MAPIIRAIINILLLPDLCDTTHPSLLSTMALSSSSLPTETSLLSPVALAQSPHLPALVELVNYTYHHLHSDRGNGRRLPPDPATRLRSLTQLCAELEPSGFTILIFSSEFSQDEHVDGLVTNGTNGKTLIATASAKPYVANMPYVATKPDGEEMGKDAFLLFKRPPPDVSKTEMSDENGEPDGDAERWPKWEILAVAVHPILQGRGLASTLMDQTIEEIKARAYAAIPSSIPTQRYQNPTDGAGHPRILDSGEKGAKGKVMLMLSTMLEFNESYYLKRGFVTTGVRRVEPGTMGSLDGFSVVEMMRWVDL